MTKRTKSNLNNSKLLKIVFDLGEGYFIISVAREWISLSGQLLSSVELLWSSNLWLCQSTGQLLAPCGDRPTLQVHLHRRRPPGVGHRQGRCRLLPGLCVCPQSSWWESPWCCVTISTRKWWFWISNFSNLLQFDKCDTVHLECFEIRPFSFWITFHYDYKLSHDWLKKIRTKMVLSVESVCWDIHLFSCLLYKNITWLSNKW